MEVKDEKFQVFHSNMKKDLSEIDLAKYFKR